MPMDQWPTWLQQVMEAGYFAAMTKQPFNPVAMDEWKLGYRIYTESRKSTHSNSIAA
jgi:hypothetical protein